MTWLTELFDRIVAALKARRVARALRDAHEGRKIIDTAEQEAKTMGDPPPGSSQPN